MRNAVKLLCGTLVVVLVLAAGSIGSANRLSVSEDEFVIIWSALTFTTDAGTRTTCPVTLWGDFDDRTMTKTSGSSIGDTYGELIDEDQCTGGRAIALSLTGWHVYYQAFQGRLPVLTGVTVRMTHASIYYETPLFDCLIRNTNIEPTGGTFTVSGGSVTSFVMDSALQIDLDQFPLCVLAAGDASFSGSASVESGSGRSLSITLM